MQIALHPNQRVSEMVDISDISDDFELATSGISTTVEIQCSHDGMNFTTEHRVTLKDPILVRREWIKHNFMRFATAPVDPSMRYFMITPSECDKEDEPPADVQQPTVPSPVRPPVAAPERPPEAAPKPFVPSQPQTEAKLTPDTPPSDS